MDKIQAVVKSNVRLKMVRSGKKPESWNHRNGPDLVLAFQNERWVKPGFITRLSPASITVHYFWKILTLMGSIKMPQLKSVSSNFFS